MDLGGTAMNRLANEISSYLRQHAGNPVDWYPWGPEAIERAKRENKPIFLSVGYSACHWCHVMEHESFTDAEVADVLNEHFVSIKVDREERPDLDSIYMKAVVGLTGHGGWPMSVFLTPDLQPFYAGTYFPPRDHSGLPSFRRILQAILDAWKSRPEEVKDQAGRITAALAEQDDVFGEGDVALSEELLKQARLNMNRAFDRRHGGFGRAPKFPHPIDLRLLLRLHDRLRDDDALEMVKLTLEKMARGGIYDQLAGGFHRYSTDERWLVPHFEKMLYDNALLVPVYLETYQLTGDAFFRRIAEETLGWVEREMTSPAGGFYSTTDADSEGVEGKYFVWSTEEVRKVLGEDAEFAMEVFDITEGGNWEGHTILTRPKTDSQEAKLRQMSEDDFRAKLRAVKARLLIARETRVKPARDEKILAAWNGLMIAAFAEAGSILDEQRYVHLAAGAAEFILTKMRTSSGGLLRTALADGTAKLPAYLEDYAFVIHGLLPLFQATGESKWLTAATELAGAMIRQFWDDKEGGFFFIGPEHEQLILREKQVQDNATPSGNSVAAFVLLQLGRLTGTARYTELAERTLKLSATGMAEHPLAFGQLLTAVDDYLGPGEEFVVFGEGEEKRQALAAIHARYRPRKVVVPAQAGLNMPLVQHRTAVDGRVTVYHCVNQTCEQPWVGVDQVRQGLGSK
jgi:uncharacterized protein